MAKILVTDDEESYRYAYSRFLAAAGHAATAAADLPEALALMEGEAFDLILTDICLPGGSGVEIVKATRSRTAACPVIMITGYPEVETTREAFQLGAYDFICKPVSEKDLLNAVRKGLAHKELLDEKAAWQANLEAIFRSDPDGLISVDPDLRVVAVNEAAGEICGLRRDVVGKPFAALAGKCNGRCLEMVRTTVLTGEAVYAERLVCQGGAAVPRVVAVATAPLRRTDSTKAGAILIVTDQTRIAQLEQDLNEVRQLDRLVGESDGMKRVFSLVETLAGVATTVLITGETGTGKGVVAEALHFGGPRGEKPLVKVDCAAFPDELLESELFGHAKGAFTGATTSRTGRFELADQGTIFLDEIGDITPRTQLRLLRVLQEKQFERLGDSRPIAVDVRIVAATNRKLRELVRAGRFRQDLYYRLNVVEIAMPPLRARRGDIPLLVDHFIKRLRRKLDREAVAVSDEVMAIFMQHDWPGNVRELKHALEHGLLLAENGLITPAALPRHLRPESPTPAACGSRDTIVRALEKSGWNKAKAARLLSMSRQTIYRKMREFGILREGEDI